MKAKAGIFWEVKKQLVFDLIIIEFSCNDEYISYPYSSIDLWNRIKPNDVDENYDEFPRAILLYDVAGEKYKLYVDKRMSPMFLERLINYIDPEVYLQAWHTDRFVLDKKA